MKEQLQKYLNEREVSEFTGLSLSSLRNNRHMGKGFAYSKLGKSVRYSIRDITSYMESCRIQPFDGSISADRRDSRAVS